MPFRKNIGMNIATVVAVDAISAPHTCRVPSLTQPDDVLQHDNRRIQHHADGERQPGQGNDVQGPPGDIQHHECGQQ
jgi:hypothetical protein